MRPPELQSTTVDQADAAFMAANGMTGVDGMASEIFNRGPIACGIVASKIIDYTSDIASGYSLNTDHIISVVGCDNDETEREYWILRNSW